MENNSHQVQEKIVMTPVMKSVGHSILRMERISGIFLQNGTDKAADEPNSNSVHVAGGNHSGIVINKEANGTQNGLASTDPHLVLALKVFLVNNQTSTHTQEQRTLRFWFSISVSENERFSIAQNFLRALVNPVDFPREYVGFFMRIIKLMQLKFLEIQLIEVEMRQTEEIVQPPSRPMSVDQNGFGSKIELTEEKVLEIIESAYPNPVHLEDMALNTESNEEDVHYLIQELIEKGLIKQVDRNAFTRVIQNDREVKLVKNMPQVVRSKQPTIAIITAQYCEKLAVDAMIQDTETYVRYKTEGESNVYTLGYIGEHRVVCTKLPVVGSSRGELIAAGNSTTRLLGTFQRVDYVFLVGVGGGVPHYTDFTRHVRLGDIVVSAPPQKISEEGMHLSDAKPYIYIECEQPKKQNEEVIENGTTDPYAYRSLAYTTWCPSDLELQSIAVDLWDLSLQSDDPAYRPWEQFIEEGLGRLQDQEIQFNRPTAESDKLYMPIGSKEVVELVHPVAPAGTTDIREEGRPVIHFGPIGSGKDVVSNETLRQEVASNFGIAAFDSQFHAVVESVYGNRKDKYMFIRGVADYKDGTRKKEWQPYSALAAAAFMKSIICSLPPPE